MKKGTFILVFVLLSILCVPVTAAAFDTVLNSSTDDITKGGTTGLVVTLDLASSLGDDVEIGFTSEENFKTNFTGLDYNVSSIDTFALQGTGGVASIPEGQHLYVYWKVRGTQPFTVNLYNNGALTTEAEGEGAKSLDWTISWNGGQSSVGGEGNYNTTGAQIIDRSDTTVPSTFGYEELTIETANYEENVVGVYTGTITLNITPVQ